MGYYLDSFSYGPVRILAQDGNGGMNKLGEIQLLNIIFLGTLNELEKVASKIHNAVNDPEQLDLLNTEATKGTIKRLHGEALETNTKIADILDGNE